MDQSLPQFLRKRIILKNASQPLHREHQDSSKSEKALGKKPNIGLEKPSVLVINSSNQMAQMITRQLLHALPQCKIMYSPSLELAAWMLQRKAIKLIISSEVLPDGGPKKLKKIVRKLADPPDVVIVGKSLHHSVSALKDAGYRLVERKKIAPKNQSSNISINFDPKRNSAEEPKEQLSSKLTSLGADLRNDLNNPLQEIVTLAYVVQQSSPTESITQDAIAAIEQAAKQMAGTVSGLEQRIKRVVES